MIFVSDKCLLVVFKGENFVPKIDEIGDTHEKDNHFFAADFFHTAGFK